MGFIVDGEFFGFQGKPGVFTASPEQAQKIRKSYWFISGEIQEIPTDVVSPEAGEPVSEIMTETGEPLFPAQSGGLSWSELRKIAKKRGIAIHGKTREQLEKEVEG